jgi:RecB family endonuclease NucS
MTSVVCGRSSGELHLERSDAATVAVFDDEVDFRSVPVAEVGDVQWVEPIEEIAMAMSAPQSEEPDLVGVLAADDVDRAVAESLAELGLSFAELEAEAAQGRFSSDRARLVWLAIRKVAAPA